MFNKFLLPALLLFGTSASAQSYFYDSRYYDSPLLVEAGISAGAMNCLTDLGGKPGKGKGFIKDLDWKTTRLCGGLHLGILYQYAIGARLEVTFGSVRAADSVLKHDHSIGRHRFNRNLHFRSRIKEFSLLTEFYPLAMTGPYGESSPCAPYLLAGIGIFAFNPETIHNGQPIALRPLRTEGQAFREYPHVRPYGRTQFNFSIGAGVRYELSALLCLRLELVHRILQTDYLDDVSGQYIDARFFSDYHNVVNAGLAEELADRRIPNAAGGNKRGNPSKNDAYFTLQLKAVIILNRRRL